MVQYTSWRDLLWLQVAMIGLSLVVAFFYVPASRLDKPRLALNLKGWDAVSQFNPQPTFKQMLYPNVSFTVGHTIYPSLYRGLLLIPSRSI